MSSDRMSNNPRVRWQALGLGLVLLAGLYALRLHETPIGAVTDDAYYIEMARSVAEGRGPVISTGPDAHPTNPGIFPSGFPLLLSPLARFFPDSVDVFKVVPLLGAVLLIPLCLWLPGPAADKRLHLIIVGLVMLNPWVIAWSGRVLSDVPFAALSLGALLLFLRIQARGTSARGEVFALIVLCGVAVSVRAIGWAAVLAMSVILVTQRRWLWAAVLPVGVATTLLPAWLFLPNSDGLVSQSYAIQMFSHNGVPLWRFILNNLLQYVAELPVILLPLFGSPLQAMMQKIHMGILYPAAAFLVGAVMLVLAGLAIARRSRHPLDSPRIRLMAIYLVIYGGVLALFDGYPSGVQTRLLIPVLPILVWLVLLGLQEMFGDDRHLMPRLVVGLMIVAALAHNGWRVAYPLRTSVEINGHGLVDPGQGAAWMTANMPMDAVILAQEPLQRHIHWCRQVVALPDTISAGTLTGKVRRYGVTFVFVGPSVHHHPNCLDAKGQALLDVLQSQPAHYQPVYTDSAHAIHIFARRN